MKDIYYFIKTLKTIFGKKLVPILLLVLFTIFIFAIFHNSVRADDVGYYIAPQIGSLTTLGHISSDSQGDNFVTNPNGLYERYKPFYQSFTSFTVPAWMTEYNYYIFFYNVNTSAIFSTIILFDKSIQPTSFNNTIGGNYTRFDNSTSFYGINFNIRDERIYYLSDYYNYLVNLEARLPNLSVTRVTTNANMFVSNIFSSNSGLRLYLSNCDLYFSSYSSISPILKNSYDEWLSPELIIDESMISNYTNLTNTLLTIDMNDFAQPFSTSYLVAEYCLPNTDEWKTNQFPTYPIVTNGANSANYLTKTSDGFNCIYNFDTIFPEFSSFTNGTKIKIYQYIDNQYEFNYEDICWEMSFTVGDESSFSYIPAEGDQIGGGDDNPPNPSNPDYTGQLEDIDSTIQDGFDSVLDSSFTIGEFPPEHSTGGNETNYLNFIDLFFTQMQQVFTYDLDDVETISLEVPFTKDGVPIKISSDLISSHLSGRGSGLMFYTLLQALYAWIFTRYIFIFCFNIINKFKSGQFMDGSLDSNDTMLNNML